MEFIIELILELLFEGGKEICTNKKISKWISNIIYYDFFFSDSDIWNNCFRNILNERYCFWRIGFSCNRNNNVNCIYI